VCKNDQFGSLSNGQGSTRWIIVENYSEECVIKVLNSLHCSRISVFVPWQTPSRTARPTYTSIRSLSVERDRSGPERALHSVTSSRMSSMARCRSESCRHNLIWAYRLQYLARVWFCLVVRCLNACFTFYAQFSCDWILQYAHTAIDCKSPTKP